MRLLATRLLHSVDLATLRAQADKTSHTGALALVVVAVALFVCAIVVRKIIKLAILVVLAGIVALLFAGWRAGLFS